MPASSSSASRPSASTPSTPDSARNELYMADLETDIAASRAAYVALAVTEIASLRGQLSGLQLG